jgi:HAD superfamily hydrolase (TIGR01549 family)
MSCFFKPFGYMKRWSTVQLCLSSTMKASPVLRGVVLDMDGTLTIPNLDFSEMYRRCGVDLKDDILQVLSSLPEGEAAPKYNIIEEMEAEAANSMKILPGAMEMVTWFRSHQIPMAVVTRNTEKSVVALRQLIGDLDIVVARDSHTYLPPKPDPSAMYHILQAWEITDPSSIVMIGDSPANDVEFGKRAGTQTALLDSNRKYFDTSSGKVTSQADITVDQLHLLPCELWKTFEFMGNLGTHSPMKKYEAPYPSSSTCIAAYGGNISGINLDEVHVQDEWGNTPLIWAADAGHDHAVLHIVKNCPPDTIDSRGFLGATAVSRAARRGYTKVLENLLVAGANPNICNEKMQYPLHFAAFQEHLEIVNILLKHGANPRFMDRKGRIPAFDTKNEEIRAVLLQAASRE